jgi:hypothetical protein
MTFLRSVAGYERMDKKRNTGIRRELKIFNLGQKKGIPTELLRTF